MAATLSSFIISRAFRVWPLNLPRNACVTSRMCRGPFPVASLNTRCSCKILDPPGYRSTTVKQNLNSHSEELTCSLKNDVTSIACPSMKSTLRFPETTYSSNSARPQVGCCFAVSRTGIKLWSISARCSSFCAARGSFLFTDDASARTIYNRAFRTLTSGVRWTDGMSDVNLCKVHINQRVGSQLVANGLQSS